MIVHVGDALDAVIVIDALSALQEELLQSEIQLTAKTTSARQRELRAGRTAARIGLRELQLDEAPILSGSDGEPIWPQGVCGSLSHTTSHAAALVSRTEVYHSVGLDVNDRRPLGSHLEAKVATPEERESFCRTFPAREVGNIVFSAKEAFFKCQFTLTRIADLHFDDVILQPSCMDRAFSILCPRVGAVRDLTAAVSVHIDVLQDQVVAWALWRRHGLMVASV